MLSPNSNRNLELIEKLGGINYLENKLKKNENFKKEEIRSSSTVFVQTEKIKYDEKKRISNFIKMNNKLKSFDELDSI
jgi:hypothetical protein